ncbi:MAG: sensor histidine kinase [Lachnospiraceae bacterium]
MKFKTQLFIAFFLIILLPIVMMSVLLSGLYLIGDGNKVLGVTFTNIPVEILDLFKSIAIFMIIILALTAIVMSLWLYQSVMAPIQHMAKASKRIRDGNLDFEIKKEGPKEVRELCNDFEEMRVRLKEANEAKIVYDKESKVLISNISHDLRTPIASIKGYVEGIMDGVADSPEKMEKYLKTIYNKANEMDRLINELTIYSKIDTNRMPYTFTKTRVRFFFDEMSSDIKLDLDGKNIGFTYENDVDPDTIIIADNEQILRVMNNIIGNSVKYMDKPSPRIDMKVKDKDDFIVVEVKDNGRGISKQDISNVFNRFYRGDASRSSSQGGSGIGLSIVKKIMEDHGGRAWVSSVEGSETTMYLEFRKYEETKNE